MAGGKRLCWDVTDLPTGQLLHRYTQSITASAGAVAELAATRKVAKYSALENEGPDSQKLGKLKKILGTFENRAPAHLPAHCCRVS